MEIEELVNEVVIHKLFGKGVICSADGMHIEVDFPERKSKFAYPLCFDGFLLFDNTELQVEIQKVIEEWKVDSGIAQKEELWMRYEKTMQGIKDRQAAAAEKKLKAAQRSMGNRQTYNNTKQEKG